MYHNIDDCCSDRYIVSPRKFENQLKLIKALKYQSMTLSEIGDAIANKKLCHPTVMLTFDDGYEDNYKIALPLLKKYGMKATIFAAAGLVGNYNDWDRDKRKRQFRHMGWDELREWSHQGMEVGSHTMSHPRLSKITSEQNLEKEIFGSKKILEEKLQQSIHSFGYPYGDFDERVKKMVQRAGYLAAVSTKSGTPKDDSDMFSLPRYEVPAHCNIANFACRLVAWF